MATLAPLRPSVPRALLRIGRPASVSPVALVLVVLALAGVAWAFLGPTPSAPASPPAPALTASATQPAGDIPIIGDPIRDLTIWWSNRLSDASRAGLDNLRGGYLTPIDPLADAAIKTLYGKILLITIPLLTLGGMILGYLIMTARTSGETAYSARAVTPRFVVGATLSVLGIYLVSVFAQFVAATDLAMIGVAIPGNAVGGPDAWPASGGVFQVLQNASFDPRIAEGPNNWNDGAWLIEATPAWPRRRLTRKAVGSGAARRTARAMPATPATTHARSAMPQTRLAGPGPMAALRVWTRPRPAAASSPRKTTKAWAARPSPPGELPDTLPRTNADPSRTRPPANTAIMAAAPASWTIPIARRRSAWRPTTASHGRRLPSRSGRPPSRP
jgi:hypothetical protein